MFLKVSQISHENAYVRVPFNKVAGRKAWNIIKRRLQHRCFPVKFAKILRTPFFIEHLRWLLPEMERESFHVLLPWFSQMLCLTLSWWRSLSYGKQSIYLLCKSMDWFLYIGTSAMKELINIHILCCCLIYILKVKLWLL